MTQSEWTPETLVQFSSDVHPTSLQTPSEQTLPLKVPRVGTAPDGLQSWSFAHGTEHVLFLHCARTSSSRFAHSPFVVQPGLGVQSYDVPSQP